MQTLQGLQNVGPLSIPNGQTTSPFLTPGMLGPAPQLVVLISPGGLTGQVHIEAAPDGTLSSSAPIPEAAGGDIDAAGGGVFVPTAVIQGGFPWAGIRLVSSAPEGAQRDFQVWVWPAVA